MAKVRSTPKAARKRGRNPAKPLPRAAKRRGGVGATSPKRPIAKSRGVAKPLAAARGTKVGARAAGAGSGRASRSAGRASAQHGVAIIPEMQPPPLPSPIASFTF